MKSKRFLSPTATLTTVVLALSAASSSHAATISWSGTTNTAWATGTNRTGGTASFNDLTTDIELCAPWE